MNKMAKKLLWRVVQIIVIAVIFYFLGKQVCDNWEKVQDFHWQVNYLLLSLSVISTLVTFFILSSLYRLIFASLGRDIGYLKLFRIAYLSNLGKYIPGKFWQMFGFIYLAGKEGITEAEAVTSFGLSLIFSLPASLAAGLVYLLLYPDVWATIVKIPFLAAGMTIMGLSVLTLSILVVFFSDFFERQLNRLIVIFRRQPISFKVNKSLAAALYGGYVLGWSLYGFSFWLFLKGMVGQDMPLFLIIGLFILAYQIGYLTLFAPGGMGPREAVMTLLLSPIFGPAVSVAVAIASRLWIVVVEVLSTLLALRIK